MGKDAHPVADIPDDFKNEFETIAQKRVRRDMPRGIFRLSVSEGVDAGRTLVLDGTGPARSLIGTSQACQLLLADPTVSRRHVALEVDDALLRVTDLGSKNGTRLGGTLVREAFVETEGTLRMGNTAIRVSWDPTGLAAPLSPATAFGPVIGASRAMRRLYPLCEKLALADIPVVIEGETGTGKEQLAEALHQMGRRAAGPFVVFDCTAVPANLVEAELFGHARGAFTGADSARKGVFEEADGGTLFIDEIGDLDLALQPKLLRAIDRNEVRPVGSTRTLKVDLRIVAATRRDLDREVQEGRFRDDLFHRLAVGRLELPPLRARAADVAVLARHFWSALGGQAVDLTPELLQRFEAHDWPGNVRELRNTVARHLALGELAGLGGGGEREDTIADEGMQAWLEDLVDVPLSEARQRVIERFERHYVRKVLERHGGNVTAAAKQAGIARRYLQILKARSAGDAGEDDEGGP
jgi:DNA-binding NtrC family response regulator